MATYMAHDALRLPVASLLANSGLCVNIEIKICLLLGVNVDTAIFFASAYPHTTDEPAATDPEQLAASYGQVSSTVSSPDFENSG